MWSHFWWVWGLRLVQWGSSCAFLKHHEASFGPWGVRFEHLTSIISEGFALTAPRQAKLVIRKVLVWFIWFVVNVCIYIYMHVYYTYYIILLFLDILYILRYCTCICWLHIYIYTYTLSDCWQLASGGPCPGNSLDANVSSDIGGMVRGKSVELLGSYPRSTPMTPLARQKNNSTPNAIRGGLKWPRLEDSLRGNSKSAWVPCGRWKGREATKLRSLADREEHLRNTRVHFEMPVVWGFQKANGFFIILGCFCRGPDVGGWESRWLCFFLSAGRCTWACRAIVRQLCFGLPQVKRHCQWQSSH